MAWVKIPADHHPLFLAAVPKDPRVTTLKMFGGIAAKANGQMFAGLFAKSFIVKLGPADHAEAMALDGAEQFDPMGNGRVMTNTVLMPEETFGDDAELRRWLRRALDHTLTLPAKKEKPAPAKKPVPKKPAPKPAAKLAAKKKR
jgi:TfoX/Sxy family transcriptional regulator of competence genes